MKHYHRIAIYVQDLNPSYGGIERVTYILSRELIFRRYDIFAIHINNLPDDRRLYSHYKGLHQGNAVRLDDIPKIIKFITENRIEVFLNQISRCYPSIALQKAIKNETSVLLVNVFHTTPLLLNSLKVFSRPLPIPRFLNRVLFSIHKSVILKPRYRKGNRLSYELCDAFIMLSSYYVTEFANDNKIEDSRKLFAIANPCEAVYLHSVQKEKIILLMKFY